MPTNDTTVFQYIKGYHTDSSFTAYLLVSSVSMRIESTAGYNPQPEANEGSQKTSMCTLRLSLESGECSKGQRSMRMGGGASDAKSSELVGSVRPSTGTSNDGSPVD